MKESIVGLKFIRVVLLLSILFNISHASIIATQEHCEHKDVSEYVMEQTQDSECGDICDIHHMFHFTAIITSHTPTVDSQEYIYLSTNVELYYYPPTKEKAYKPPIS